MEYQSIMIISDVDGTLLEKGFGVPEKNIEAIEGFVAKGGLFTVATERSVESFGRFVDWIPLSAPAILLGGAVIYDYKQKKYLKRRPMQDWQHIVKKIIFDFKNLCVELFLDNACYTVKNGDCSAGEHILDHTSFVITDSAFVSAPVYKIRLCGSKKEIDRFCRFSGNEANKLIFAGNRVVRTSPETADILSDEVSKKIAAFELARHMGIKEEAIVAIGNGVEDRELLECSAFSALVANADDSAFGGASISVAGCSAGGLAQFINEVEKHFGLI